MTEATSTPAPPARSAGSTPPALILAGLGILGLLVFVTGLAMGADGWDALILLLALLTAFVGSAPIIIDQSRPVERRHLLITLVMLTYMIFLVVPVFTQYFLLKGEFQSGSFALNRNLPEDIAHAQTVALGGLLALLAGFYLPFGRLAVSMLPKPTLDWTPTAALVVALFMLALGWSVYLGGQFGLIPPRAGTGALGTLAMGVYFGISLLTLVWLRYRDRRALAVMAFAIAIGMAFNFFTGSKRLFLTPPFMVAIAFIVFERRIRRSWAIAGFLLIVFLYPVSQFYRDVVLEGFRLSTTQIVTNPGEALSQVSSFVSNASLGEYFRTGLQATGARLDGLATLTVIVRDTPERVPYQGGWTIGYILLSYVPRAIWPGKPATTIGEWVSQTYGSPYDLHTDVGPSWVGEFFFNFGYLGVGVGMFLMGMFFRMLQERLFHWGAPIPAMLGACVVVYAVARTVQGGIIGPINGTLYNLPPILIAHYALAAMGGVVRPGRRKPTATGVAPQGSSQPAHGVTD